MEVTAEEILERLRGAERPTDRFLRDAIFLVERVVERRRDDHNYLAMGFPVEWLALTLTTRQLDDFVEAFAAVMDTDPALAPRAAWGLGKARHDRGVERLIARLEKCWQSPDELTFQILFALGTFGEERAWPLIERIAAEGAGAPCEEARRMLAFREEVRRAKTESGS
jgi:HEAT repeat protein